MTDQPAAIQATFSDVKLIRSRKVCQLVLEIPLEQADAALSTLGGIPQPHSERWVALARLNGVTKPKPESSKGVTYGEFAEVVENAYYKTHPEEAAKKKRQWEDLKLSMQAGIRCEEPPFWRFLSEHYKMARPMNADDAAHDVRWLCGVDSRRGLNTDPEAAAKWRDLDRSYQAWLKVAG
jgi:hypothetical protein